MSRLTVEAFDVLNQIEQTNSSNAKKQLLNEHIDNNILFDILYWTYNPFYRYYIKKAEPNIIGIENKISHKYYGKHIVEFKRILSKLNARKLSGNNAKDVVKDFLNQCDTNEQKWYLRILKRDLRCGISVTTINNVYGVYGNVIDSFPVALAENPTIRVYPKNFCIDEKFDGYRCLTEISENGASMYSRNGNDLEGYDDISDLFTKCNCSRYNVVLDGELISSDFKGTQNNAFRKTNGKKANYYVFDLIGLSDFYDVTGYYPLAKRIKLRHTYLEMIREEAEKQQIDMSFIVEVNPILYYVNGRLELREDFADAYNYLNTHFKPKSNKELMRICDEAFEYSLSLGREGVIVKDLDSLYMTGKSYASTCIDVKRKNEKWYSWAKRKPTDTYDLVVDSIYEGTGINEGSLGGVNVIYNASDGNDYLVGVGSGFKQDERIYYWNNPNEIIGKTIEVEADVESQDANGNYSLRFPRFKCVRRDK